MIRVTVKAGCDRDAFRPARGAAPRFPRSRSADKTDLCHGSTRAIQARAPRTRRTVTTFPRRPSAAGIFRTAVRLATSILAGQGQAIHSKAPVELTAKVSCRSSALPTRTPACILCSKFAACSMSSSAASAVRALAHLSSASESSESGLLSNEVLLEGQLPARLMRSAQALRTLLLVVDISGSMSERLPLLQRVLRDSEAKLRELERHGRLGCVLFDSKAEQVSLTEVLEARDRGGTSFPAALRAVRKFMGAPGQSDKDSTIVFMTDGMNNEETSSVDHEVAETGLLLESVGRTVVHTMGISNGHDFNFLSRLQKLGAVNGEYLFADTVDELFPKFRALLDFSICINGVGVGKLVPAGQERSSSGAVAVEIRTDTAPRSGELARFSKLVPYDAYLQLRGAKGDGEGEVELLLGNDRYPVIFTVRQAATRAAKVEMVAVLQTAADTEPQLIALNTVLNDNVPYCREPGGEGEDKTDDEAPQRYLNTREDVSEVAHAMKRGFTGPKLQDLRSTIRMRRMQEAKQNPIVRLPEESAKALQELPQPAADMVEHLQKEMASTICTLSKQSVSEVLSSPTGLLVWGMHDVAVNTDGAPHQPSLRALPRVAAGVYERGAIALHTAANNVVMPFDDDAVAKVRGPDGEPVPRMYLPVFLCEEHLQRAVVQRKHMLALMFCQDLRNFSADNYHDSQLLALHSVLAGLCLNNGESIGDEGEASSSSARWARERVGDLHKLCRALKGHTLQALAELWREPAPAAAELAAKLASDAESVKDPLQVLLQHPEVVHDRKVVWDFFIVLGLILAAEAEPVFGEDAIAAALCSHGDGRLAIAMLRSLLARATDDNRASGSAPGSSDAAGEATIDALWRVVAGTPAPPSPSDVVTRALERLADKVLEQCKGRSPAGTLLQLEFPRASVAPVGATTGLPVPGEARVAYEKACQVLDEAVVKARLQPMEAKVVSRLRRIVGEGGERQLAASLLLQRMPAPKFVPPRAHDPLGPTFLAALSDTLSAVAHREAEEEFNNMFGSMPGKALAQMPSLLAFAGFVLLRGYHRGAPTVRELVTALLQDDAVLALEKAILLLRGTWVLQHGDCEATEETFADAEQETVLFDTGAVWDSAPRMLRLLVQEQLGELRFARLSEQLDGRNAVSGSAFKEWLLVPRRKSGVAASGERRCRIGSPPYFEG